MDKDSVITANNLYKNLVVLIRDLDCSLKLQSMETKLTKTQLDLYFEIWSIAKKLIRMLYKNEHELLSLSFVTHQHKAYFVDKLKICLEDINLILDYIFNCYWSHKTPTKSERLIEIFNSELIKIQHDETYSR